MKEELWEILRDLEMGKVSVNYANHRILRLFDVVKSVCENCGKDEAVICQHCYDVESQFRECY